MNRNNGQHSQFEASSQPLEFVSQSSSMAMLSELAPLVPTRENRNNDPTTLMANNSSSDEHNNIGDNPLHNIGVHSQNINNNSSNSAVMNAFSFAPARNQNPVSGSFGTSSTLSQGNSVSLSGLLDGNWSNSGQSSSLAEQKPLASQTRPQSSGGQNFVSQQQQLRGVTLSPPSSNQGGISSGVSRLQSPPTTDRSNPLLNNTKVYQQQKQQQQQQQQQPHLLPPQQPADVISPAVANQSAVLDQQSLVRLQGQFEKILKFMDNVDYRLNKLENATREILSNQKIATEQRKKYRQTVLPQLDYIKQLQQQQNRALNTVASSMQKTSSVTPTTITYPSTTPPSSSPINVDADLEIARKLQAKYNAEKEKEREDEENDKKKKKSRHRKRSGSFSSYPGNVGSGNFDTDLELAKQLQAQYDAENSLTLDIDEQPIETPAPDNKKQTGNGSGFFSKLFGGKNSKETASSKQDKEEEEPTLKRNNVKSSTSRPSSKTTPNVQSGTTRSTTSVNTPKPINMPSTPAQTQMYQPPTMGTPYPYYGIPQVVYQPPQMPLQPMAPYPTTQAYQQQPGLYYMPQ